MIQDGYNKAKLEGHEKRLDRIECKIDVLDEKLDSITNNIAYFKGIAGVLGAVAGVVTSLITKYILGR